MGNWIRIHRLIKVLFIGGLLLIILGCENQASPTSKDNDGNQERHEGGSQEPSVTKESIHIGFSMDTLEEERWLKDRDYFKESAEAMGAKVEIMFAHEDDALQLEHVETLISQGLDILVVVPNNAEAAAAIVDKAHLAGIKVISYDRLIKNANVDIYISFDNEQVGVLQGKTMLDLVPKGNYVYIGGAETDNNAHLLKKGAFHVLQPYIEKGDIRIVYDQWTQDWSPTQAYQNMEEALKANNYKIDAVIAGNDGTAGGAIKALEAHGLAGKIPVVGQDADLAAIRRIAEGTQAMTVYKPLKTLTEKVTQIAYMLANDEKVETNLKMNNGKHEIPTILLSPIAVDSANIDSTVIADGFHSWEDIYETSGK